MIGDSTPGEGERQMREVRVYANHEEGPTWCAEDGLGFFGGADCLDELLASIDEWAEAEGLTEELEVRHVAGAQGVPLERQQTHA